MAGATLGEIAQVCGISRGTLYYYYRSKDDLILDINEWNMEKITRGLLELLEACIGEGRGMGEILTEAFRTITGAEARGRLHLHLLNEAFSRNPALVGRLKKSYRRWFRLMETALEELLPVGADGEALARGIVASLDGMVIQSLLSLDEIPLERIVGTAVQGFNNHQEEENGE